MLVELANDRDAVLQKQETGEKLENSQLLQSN